MSNIKLNDYLNKQLQNQKFQKEFEQETIQLERSFAHDVSEKHCPVARTESQEVKRPHSSRRYGI